MRIVLAKTSIEFDAVRNLFQDYAASLKINLGFQSFDEELLSLPGHYGQPKGKLLLAVSSDEMPAGCVGLRPLDEDVAELRRLYVRPAFRRHGLGKRLVAKVLDDARRLGYRRVRLDTLPTLTDAIWLYESFGFRDIVPYCHNPIEESRFLEFDCGAHSP